MDLTRSAPLRRGREAQLEYRSPAWRTLDVHVAFGLLDNGQDDGQPESRSLSGRFRREERFEESRLRLFVETAAGVFNGDGHTPVRCDACRDGDYALVGHRVPCVHHQVDDRLFQLSFVHTYTPDGRGELQA